MTGLNKRLFFKDFESDEETDDRTVKIDFDPSTFFETSNSENIELQNVSEPEEQAQTHQDVESPNNVEEALKSFRTDDELVKEEPIPKGPITKEPETAASVITKAINEMKEHNLKKKANVMNITGIEKQLEELKTIKKQNTENLEKMKDVLKSFENTTYEKIVNEKFDAFLPKINSYHRYLSVCERSLENVIENMKGLDAFSEF